MQGSTKDTRSNGWIYGKEQTSALVNCIVTENSFDGLVTLSSTASAQNTLNIYIRWTYLTWMGSVNDESCDQNRRQEKILVPKLSSCVSLHSWQEFVVSDPIFVFRHRFRNPSHNMDFQHTFFRDTVELVSYKHEYEYFSLYIRWQYSCVKFLSSQCPPSVGLWIFIKKQIR